jgi:hypothetical protein
MLVRFRSNAGDITMFGKDALPLIKMMGHSGTMPSAIVARDLPNALLRLKEGVAAVKVPQTRAQDRVEDPDEEPPVPLSKRAFPLIELLERCVKNDCDLLWEQQGPQSYT